MYKLISSSNYEHFKFMRNKLIKKQFNVCELDKTSLATFVIDLKTKLIFDLSLMHLLLICLLFP